MLHDAPQAARAFGLQMQILNASTENEIEAAFDTLVRDRIDALFVTPDTYFISQRDQLAALTARYRIPATFPLAKRPKLAG
jgi:putative ABC transport system substrate-binding protein